MSVRALSWALREAPVTVKSDLLVLIVLADHAHDDGGGAYPSVATIAHLSRLTPRGAQKSLRRLEDVGVITAKPKVGRATVYTLLMGEHSSEVNTVHPEQGDTGGRTGVQKPPNTVHPNREPSSNRQGAQARNTTSPFDRTVKG